MAVTMEDHAKPVARARPLQIAREAAPVILLIGSLVVWLGALRPVDLRTVTDLGLITAVSPWMLGALAILAGAFVLELCAPEPRVVILGATVILLALMLHGLASAVEQEPRGAATWIHLGLVEYIARTGSIAPGLDPRLDWPGFFALVALIGHAAGLTDFSHIAQWFPVAANIAYALAMVLIARGLGLGPRMQWLAAWFFLAANWIGQDYFSPQAFALFLYLVVVAVILRWFAARGDPNGAVIRWFQPAVNAASPPSTSGFRRVSLLLLLVAMTGAMASSQQLTPLVAVLTLGILAVARRTRLYAMPVIAGLLAAAWIAYATFLVLGGDVSQLLATIGRLNDTVAGGVLVRFVGSSQHQLIVTERVVLTAVVFGLALAGFVRSFLDHRRDLLIVTLAGAPFLLAGLQGSGGEIVLRLFLFSLPWMAVLIALLFVPPHDARPSWIMAGAVWVVSVILLVGTVAAKYGNERMDAVTPDEVAATTELYRIAPPGSLLLAGAPNLPWKDRLVEQYRYPDGSESLATDYATLATLLAEHTYPGAYVIVTRSQQAYVEMYSGLPPDAWPNFEADLANDVAAGRLRIVYENRDAQIYQAVNG